MIRFCSLFSGSSGNALFIAGGQVKILIDAGLSGKRIIGALESIGENPADLSAILISHEHSDHIKGAGILSRKFNLPIYANKLTWENGESYFGKVKDENIKIINTNEMFNVCGMQVFPFSIPHDAADPVGYSIHMKTELSGEKKITIATDIGHISEGLLENLEGSDLILLESNHDLGMLQVGPYPYYLKKRIAGDYGHLSNETASQIVSHLFEKGTQKFVLGHLSNENNFPELAYLTAENVLREKAIVVGRDIHIEVASRNKPGKVINL